MKRTTVTYMLLFSGLGIFSYFLIVNYTDFSPQAIELLSSRVAFVFTIFTFNLVGYFTLWMSGWTDRLYSVNATWKWRMGSFYVVVALLYLMLNYGLLVLAKILANAEPVFSFSRNGWILLIVIWLTEMVIIGLLLSKRILQANWLLQQDTAKLQIENAQAKYVALQNQLNPHFLFNSLNTLIAEIKYNPDNAVKFTRNLSSVYRYVLQCQGKNLVSLKEELEFMDSYLFLHKVRLGDCIDCDCHIPSTCMERQILPLSLQLLMENVIKHNSISSEKPMSIRIEMADEYLVVSNPVSPKRKSEASSGIGLQNLANRCRLMTDKEIIILNDNSVFTVKIPIVQ